jgi:hypothetical protein
LQEFGGHHTIGDTVVHRQAASHHVRTRYNTVSHHRPLAGGADGEDGGLGWVDDSDEVIDAYMPMFDTVKVPP